MIFGGISPAEVPVPKPDDMHSVLRLSFEMLKTDFPGLAECRKTYPFRDATRAGKSPLGFFVAKALLNGLFCFVNAGLHVVQQFFLPFSHKLMVYSFASAVACKGRK